MKKISIILVGLILAVIALLPIVGNQFMQNYIQDGVSLLSAQGLKMKTVQTDSSYLKTKKHFEFIVKDAHSFVKYLQSHTHREFSPELNAALEGTLIGADVEYSNIPFAKSITADIYPLKVSKELEDELKTEDINFYNQFKAFLKNRGLLTHIEFNLINNKFKGYMKDIDEKYLLHNGSTVTMQLKGMEFKGKGDLAFPKSFHSEIKMINFDAYQDKVRARLKVEDFSTQEEFESWSDYATTVAFNDVVFFISGTPEDANISLKGLYASSNAVAKKAKIDLESKTNLKALHLESKEAIFDMKDLESEILVKDLDKASFNLLSEYLRQADNTNLASTQEKVKSLLSELFAKGFTIKIPNISIKSMVMNQKDDFGGLKMDANLHVKADENLSQKIKTSPLLFLQNIEFHSDIKLSKAIYRKVLNTLPVANAIASYAKEQKDGVGFEIDLKDANLSINGKALK